MDVSLILILNTELPCILEGSFLQIQISRYYMCRYFTSWILFFLSRRERNEQSHCGFAFILIWKSCVSVLLSVFAFKIWGNCFPEQRVHCSLQLYMQKVGAGSGGPQTAIIRILAYTSVLWRLALAPGFQSCRRNSTGVLRFNSQAWVNCSAFLPVHVCFVSWASILTWEGHLQLFFLFA